MGSLSYYTTTEVHWKARCALHLIHHLPKIALGFRYQFYVLRLSNWAFLFLLPLFLSYCLFPLFWFEVMGGWGLWLCWAVSEDWFAFESAWYKELINVSMAAKYSAKKNGKFVFRSIGFFCFLLQCISNSPLFLKCDLMLWIDSLFVCKSISIVSWWFTLGICMGSTVG